MDTERIRILLVDDDQGDYEMTRAMLSQIETWEMFLDWVPTYQEGLAEMEEGKHDVYLLDYFLEDRTGMDLLREAKSRGIRAPFIMLTGRGNREVDLEAMRAGAADYLVKGRVDPDLLERSIRFALERKRAEDALRESEERHRTMFDHLPIGLYRSTPDGEFLEANPALVRILGSPDRETLRTVYSSNLYVDPDERDRFWELLERYGVVRGFETQLLRQDGTTIRVRNTARLHREAEGEVAYVEGTLENMSEGYRSEDLQRTRSRFRVLFEASGLGIAVIDPDGVVTEANQALHRIFGLPGSDLEGRAYPELALEEEKEQVRRALKEVLQGRKRRVEAERRFVRANGQVFWTRTVVLGVLDSGARPEEALVLFQDIAEIGGTVQETT